jgi:mRNA interferase YafQ
MKRRGRRIHALQAITDAIISGAPLPVSARPHILRGEWAGFWECHISFDWLLIYRFAGDDLVLIRTGTHRDLFGE